MARIIVSHKVKDFDTWKVAYDEDNSNRDQAGLKELGVYREASDPNNVLVLFEGTPDKLDEMFSNPELKQKMEEAGVISAPEIIVGEIKTLRTDT